MMITLANGFIDIPVEEGLTYQIEQVNPLSSYFRVKRFEYESTEVDTFDSLQDALEHVEEEIGRV